MFKYIGIIFLFSTCVTIGFFQSYQITRRKQLLTAFRHFIQKIETEMQYFKDPLPNIFRQLVSDENTPIDLLLRQCIISFDKSNKTIAEIWKSSINEVYAQEPLKEEDLRIFEKCGDFLGQSDFLSQKSHFDLLNAQLDRQICDVAELEKTKGSLYKKAGISIGAILAITFC